MNNLMTDTTDIKALRAETWDLHTMQDATEFSNRLLDLLEAERQRADRNKVMQLAAEDVSASALRDWSSEGIKLHAANEEIKRLTAEISELKGEQVPVEEADYTRYSCGCCGFESLHRTTKCPECNYHKIESEPLYTAPQKPVVLLPVAEDYPIAWSAASVLADVKAAIEAAGGIVKDGE